MSVITDEPDGATPLDPDEREGLKFRHITTRGELNELEQVNIENGLLWLSRRRKSDILTGCVSRSNAQSRPHRLGGGARSPAR
jgi:fido (protein-threonine AMPylation protein)